MLKAHQQPILLFIFTLVAVSTFLVAHAHSMQHNLAPANIRTADKAAIDIKTTQQPLEPLKPLGYTTNQYTVVKTYNRSQPYYYTQGLAFAGDNVLLESAGLYGESSIQHLNLDNMTITDQHKLENKYFGEGADFVTDDNGEIEVYQLTWQERIVFVFNGTTLEPKRELQLPAEIAEGWGLTRRFELENDEPVQNLYITDGSDRIFVCEPKNLTVKRIIYVKDGQGRAVRNLNELEIVKGKLWANVYLSRNIAVIDTNSGNVEFFIDFNNLVNTAVSLFWGPWDRGYCLNGIAYNPKSDRLIVTGKKWTQLYEIQFNE